MRLHLILPQVKPEEITPPETCPKCGKGHLRLHQVVEKPLRDTEYTWVPAHRYQCQDCEYTFRVYPRGVTRDQTSQRVKGLAILLYLLGLSYGAVSLALEALGIYLCKSRVYDAVQEAAKRVSGMRREKVFAGVRTPAVGSDVTSVRCRGRWLPLGLVVDEVTGVVLTVDGLEGEEAEELKAWLEPVVRAVAAEVLVTDDADAFKEVAEELGVKHQVCRRHVEQNTEALVKELQGLAVEDQDGSLALVGVRPEEAVADLERVWEVVREGRPEGKEVLRELYLRYKGAAPPKGGERASVAYRIRLLVLDRWALWLRLVGYRTWVGPKGERLDGTNNAAERAIGWWIKERYWTMRGYKRVESAVGVSRLLAWCGSHLDRGGADLSLLLP